MDWPNSLLSSQKDGRYFEKIDEDSDLAFALSLQEEFNEDAVKEVLSKDAQSSLVSYSQPSGSSKPLGIVDEQWELIDPNPDIHALFLQFNTQFFYGKLLHVEVKWSPRMTTCAGVCSYEGRGGLCSVRLSMPLLELRPRKDLVETLLHEMIHAYLFVTANNKDRDGHGPEFLSHMYRINKLTGTNISVYHNFHDEVRHFQKHWWKCNGPCQKRHPFFGVVKRAMNRAPGPNDRWWAAHVANCGGTFTKIKEPPQVSKPSAKRKLPKESTVSKNTSDIKSFFPSNPSTSKTEDSSSTQIKKKKGQANVHTINSVFEKENNVVSVNGNDSSKTIVPADSLPNRMQTQVFSGKGFTLGSSSSTLQPMSLLSQIRKEIGYPNSRSVTQKPVAKINPSETSLRFTTLSAPAESPTLNRKKLKDIKSSKGTSSVLGDFQSSSNSSAKKLTQRSIDNFVLSPDRPSGNNLSKATNTTSSVSKVDNFKTVPCPVCSIDVPSDTINSHLDNCLSK